MTSRAVGFCLLSLFASPLLLAADEGKADVPSKPDTERWESLQKQLKKIGDDLAALKKDVELGEQARAVETKTFQDRLDKLEKSMESVRSTTRASSSFT